MKLGLRLYVTSSSSFGLAALEKVHELKARFPQHEIELEVIDVVKSPSLAEGDGITATPTLLKLSPPPVKKIVGDFSRLAQDLDLEEANGSKGDADLSAQEPNRSTLGSIGTKK